MSDLVDQHDMATAMTQLQEQREARQAEAPEAEAAPEEQPARPRRPERVEADNDDGEDLHFENDDEAYEYLQDRRDARAHDNEDTAPAAPAPRSTTTDDGDDPGALWSTEDFNTYDTLQQAAQAWQQDAAAFEQIKAQIDLNALEQRDRGQAAAARSQLNAIEADLRQSHAAIQAEAGKLQGKEQQHREKTYQKRFAAEQAKVEKLVPNLDTGRLVTYLTGPAGFSQQELADSVGDARLIAVLEKSRKWDELQEGKGPRKVPRMAKGAKGRTAQPAQPSDRVSQLRAKLEKSGSMDDALALLQAQRQARQQRKGGR